MDDDDDERAGVDEDAYDVSSVRKVQKEVATMPVAPVTPVTDDGPMPSWATKYQAKKAKEAVVRVKGKCMKWNPKGFGFVRPDGSSHDRTNDVYVHQRELHKEGFRSLVEGELVEFEVGIMDDGRPHAVHVTGPGGVEVQGQKRPRDSDEEEEVAVHADVHRIHDGTEFKTYVAKKPNNSKASLAFLPRAVKKPLPKPKPKPAAAPAAPTAAAPPALTKSVFDAHDSVTTSAIIAAFRGNATFEAFSKAEMEGIVRRDAEDDEKLASGIAMAVKKVVLAANPPVEATMKVDVLGKAADQVAQEIIIALGDAPPAKGCVLVLVGLSGTGKGTTVAKLQQLLPRCTAWSNGNVFRALTLLAVTRCEQDGKPFTSDVLSADFLGELMACLSFGKFGPSGAFDIRICGYGHDLLVSQVANTVLKGPQVGRNIPTVAEMSQGEVVGFAGGAAEQMRADGMNVLMEGRAQTLDYVRTPHRFELTLSEPLLIGMRRAAQRMMASADDILKRAGSVMTHSSDEGVKQVLTQALDELGK